MTASAKVFATLEEFVSCVGTEIGISDYLEITQERVDQFATATSDYQWIHVDPISAASGPYGTTIAHGLLSLSLIPFFSAQVFTLTGIHMGINYGFDRVRFPAPVPVGARIRARMFLKSAEKLEPMNGRNGYQTVITVTIEHEGKARPVCVADNVARRYG
ncbi:MAG: MaoC family dehydratase [Pseudomonadota bacterium]